MRTSHTAKPTKLGKQMRHTSERIIAEALALREHGFYREASDVNTNAQWHRQYADLVDQQCQTIRTDPRQTLAPWEESEPDDVD